MNQAHRSMHMSMEVAIVEKQADRIQNRYKILARLGKGGFGAVYKAADERQQTQRLVAIKCVEVVRDKLFDSRKQQIENEVQILKENAPNFHFIPNYYDSWFEQDDERLLYYIVMEYVEGDTLKDPDKLPWQASRVLDFLQTILSYLKQLHEAGIVHRDIKPDNIIKKPEGGYVIVDFGTSTQNTYTILMAFTK